MKTVFYTDDGREIVHDNPETTKEQAMNIAEATSKELVDKYNTLTGKSIKKFASRAAAEKQVAAAMAAAKPAPKAKIKKASAGGGVAGSWQDKAVAAARSKKDRVKVGGAEYRSVGAAFVALNLPMNKHIAFRSELKSKSRATFEGHIFTIVKGE